MLRKQLRIGPCPYRAKSFCHQINYFHTERVVNYLSYKLLPSKCLEKNSYNFIEHYFPTLGKHISTNDSLFVFMKTISKVYFIMNVSGGETSRLALSFTLIIVFYLQKVWCICCCWPKENDEKNLCIERISKLIRKKDNPLFFRKLFFFFFSKLCFRFCKEKKRMAKLITMKQSAWNFIWGLFRGQSYKRKIQ